MTGATEQASDRGRIYAEVREILADRLKAVDPGLMESVSESTRVMSDLDLESVTIVEFCMAIGKHFRKKFPFQQLVFKDGRFQDFTLGDLVTFIEQQLAT